MSQVTFINPIRVPPGREDDCIARWDEGAAYVRGCPGFITTSLHRSLTPASQFRFFTVAEWQSAARLHAATDSVWWREYVSRFGLGDGPEDFAVFPTVCEVIR